MLSGPVAPLPRCVQGGEGRAGVQGGWVGGVGVGGRGVREGRGVGVEGGGGGEMGRGKRGRGAVCGREVGVVEVEG
jgi:hypothetical protein